MALFVSLLLALLHAFSATSAASATWRNDAFSAARSQQRHDFARWSEQGARIPEETVRVPLRAAKAVALRSTGPVPFGRTEGLPVRRAETGTLALSTLTVRPERSADTHVLASRGSVLPYFPTAPPRRV